VDMNEHSKDLPTEGRPKGADLLRRSAIESDRKFWSGKRRLSAVQWTGIVLLYVAIGVLVAEFGRPAYILLSLGVLSIFVAIGNWWTRRKR